VLDMESLLQAMHGVQVVFHVAAVSDYWRAGMQRLYQVNVQGTRNVLRAAKAAGVERVVYTSSVAALGQPAYRQAADESFAPNLRPEEFHYGYSKWLAEQAVHDAVIAGQDVVVVNPAVVIGPRDVNQISGSIVVQEARIGIPFYPPGGVCVIDVADVCAGEIAAAERARKGERYILGGENLWYREMLTITAQVVGRATPRIGLSRGLMLRMAWTVDLMRRVGFSLPVNGDQLRFSTRTLWYDSSKARRELGLTTRPYIDAAQRAYDWYRLNHTL
jgi:dihydroflavonol-4-reductase